MGNTALNVRNVAFMAAGMLATSAQTASAMPDNSTMPGNTTMPDTSTMLSNGTMSNINQLDTSTVSTGLIIGAGVSVLVGIGLISTGIYRVCKHCGSSEGSSPPVKYGPGKQV